MSDNYRALTRTYRPRTFEDIVSQEHVSSTLKNAIKQERLAHAYMFCGPRGVGKTTMARVLARAVNEIDADIDGESLNQTLNIVEIDAASNNKVDDIRDLRERVRIPPQNGRFKIYIIDEVHMLSKSAFNALLKTLEEPPDHVIFIFATTEPHKVLPTILSRVQRFDFKRISVDEIVSRLEKVASDEGISIDHESLHVIAKKADGALRDALGLMDQAIAFCGTDISHEELLRALNVVSTDRMFEFMEAVEQHDAGAGLELINELLEEGYDIQEFLIGLTEHLRNLYVAKNSEKMHLVEASAELKKRYRRSAESFSEDDLMRMMHIASEAQIKIKDAHQPRIQFEITLLKLVHMERTENLNKLLGELHQLKKKLTNRATPAPDPSGVKSGLNGSDNPSYGSGSDEENEAESAETPSMKPATAEEPAADNSSEEPGPEKDAADSANKAPSSSDRSETPDEDGHDFFGKPSIDKGNGTAGRAEPAAVPSGSQDGGADTVSVARVSPSDLSLADIKEQWPSYLERLQSDVPQMLYFQMQRIEPVKVKNGELVLRCNDDFSRKTVDENKKQLAKNLEETCGAFFQLRCVVQKEKKVTKDNMSPFERFKQLQEKDPKIKKLVELFGAELDYNLHR